MSYFEGIGDTALFESGVYLTSGGMYELEVQKILVKKTRKSGLGFIVEFKVISASGGSEVLEKHPEGSQATWFQKMSDKDVAFPAIKEFFVGLMDINMNNEEEKEEFNNNLETILDEATEWEPNPEDPNEQHPLHGQMVHCETYSKLTEKNLDFTVHKWSKSEIEDAA